MEATHISAYTEVTQGGDAIFTIRYPLVGTTYTISDNEGNSYSFTYTSGTEEYIYINAGVVNSVRKFSLKAQKGACAYQTGFNYTITPQTALKLATRVEHEWCGNGGAIRFTLIGIGANNNNYNFYIKKSNVPTYNTTTSLSITGVTSLAAGKYDLLARPKSGTGDIEVKNIEIKKDLKDIDYTLSQIPTTCASAGIGIKVDIKVDQWGNHSANYPVYYTLQDATGNDIPGKIRQTANTFTGLTPGTYRVKVENFCGASPTPKSITIAAANLTFTNLWEYPRPKEFNCDYVEFDSVLLYGTSLTEAYTSDTFPYPLTVKYVITAPSGAVYTPTYTINNKSDFYLYLPIGTRNDLGVENGFREHRIPKEYGEWKIAAEVEMCGTTTAIPAVTATLYNPIENAYVAPVPDENSSDTCFKKVQLTLGHKYIRDNSPILNTYLVLEQAPATFNYTGAGFYQIPATHPNPLLRGKFVKKIKYNPQAYQTVVASDYTNLGDTFQFRLVDDECDTNRSNLMDAFTITTPPAPKPTNVAIRNVASCKDATATNAPYASMHIQRYVGADLDKIEVIEYNGNTTGTIPGTSLSLPYTLTASDRANNDNWYLRDLPPGNYKVRVTNVCGGVNVISKDLSGQTYSFSFAPGCEPIVQGRIDLAPTDDWRYTESSFVIQQFNEATQTWNQWAYSGLGFNQNINRKVTDEYLTRKGKFRVVRRISNLDNTFECMQVIAEKDFGGDLEEPDVIGVGCVGNKFHVVVIPKGGTGPFTYRLVHKIPAGSTTPDTSVARTQAGDNFFLDLDGTNLNTAYKFTVTDACPSTKDRELTLSNIRLPKIKAQKEYYCVGQSAVLKMDDLGPNITIEWYRSDNMAVAVATGHTLTIPALTAADFTNQYKVVIKIAGKPAAATCITNAIAAYQFQQITTYPSYTAPIGVDTSKCMEGNGAMYFDLNTLFTGTTLTTSGVTTTIEEASGVIAVPANGIININLSEVMGTHTFLYKILSPCGELITQATAKLTVARAFKPAVKTTIKVCNPSVTLNEVKQLINEGSPEVVAKQPIFHWYSSLSDAQAQTSEIAVTTSINTPNGSSQDYYLRFTKNNYCTETIYKITIVGETSVTAKTLTNTACQITTVADLKALVDPADTANVLIYKNGGTVALADETIIEDNVGYTYAKNVYRCVTSPAPLNFNFTPRSVAKNEQISVCTFIGYYGGLHTKVKDIKDALQVLYPNATITVLGSSSGNWYVQTNPNSDVSITGYSGFKIQEAGKCESLPYVVRLAQNDITPVQAQSITTCEEIMAGELADQLQATYGYTNVEIIAGRSTAPLARTAFVDWNTALYFTAEATGKCRSPKVPLTLIKDTNVTIATPKSFEVCKAAGQQPKVSDLKTVVGANARIFIRNNNQWQLQADNSNVSENNSYFYTIQEAGKCPSEKTALIVRITRKTPTPSAPTAATFCQGATLTSLKDYIDNNPQNVGTLRVYANNTDTTPLSNTTVLTNNTTYYFSLQDTDPSNCESDRRAIMVKLVPAPTVLASYTYCPGTKVETLWDAIDPNDSDHSLRIYENATGGTALSRNALLRAGNYYVAESSSSSSLGSCETSRVPLTVVFHTSPTITVQPQDATYCKGITATALSVTAIGSGTLSYQWYSNTTDSTIGGTPVGINNASYIPSTTAVGTTYYYVEVSSTTGCAAAVSRTAKVIVEQPSTPTVAQVAAAGCGTISTAKVSNYATYPTGTTFTITTATDAAVAGTSVAADGTINGITSAGTYKVKAKQGTCDSSPVTFTIDAALPMPSTPTVAQVAAAGCGTLSTAKVSNYATYPTGTTFTITTATDA
ncbi:immunoglobulin domain-containing protein, partial [Capnocytophaga leadbetteri]|uniref:immunoglobulin domain-containing protein n=1 Tax=Capnocytophaga leadbetteri TaxID=327575 RepID=UPI003C6F6F6F